VIGKLPLCAVRPLPFSGIIFVLPEAVVVFG
jgi:hypothetical protein